MRCNGQIKSKNRPGYEPCRDAVVWLIDVTNLKTNQTSTYPFCAEHAAACLEFYNLTKRFTVRKRRVR